MPRVTPEELERFVTRAIESTGTPPDAARIVANHLVESNLSGHDSHGVMRLKQYLEHAASGDVRPAAEPKVVHETSTTAVVDGGQTWGPVAAGFAMEVAIRKAREHAIAAVSVRAAYHAGRIGVYPRQAALEGLVGLAFCNVRGVARVAPWGSTERRLTTNPIAIAVPAEADPILWHGPGPFDPVTGTIYKEKAGAPTYSRDGKKLALTLSGSNGNLDIYLLDLATQQPVRLTDDPGIDTEASFAPDGSIYFTSDRSGSPQIYRMTPGSAEKPRRVTFTGSYNARPRVSPDGKHLALLTLAEGAYRIAVQDLASGSITVLSKGRQEESPSFAPNGAMLIFAGRDRGQGVLQTVSTDGFTLGRLDADAGEVREPVWGPFIP